MADYHHDMDDDVRTGFGSTVGIIVAILLVLALVVGGWLLFFRDGVDTDTDTDINIEAPDSGETTTSP